MRAPAVRFQSYVTVVTDCFSKRCPLHWLPLRGCATRHTSHELLGYPGSPVLPLVRQMQSGLTPKTQTLRSLQTTGVGMPRLRLERP